MCLLEVVDGHRPWASVADASVGHRVCQGLRPRAQLDRRKQPPRLPRADPVLARLIGRCWDHTPSARPTFPQIVSELESLAASSRSPGSE
jgi:hypothetical protein